MIFRYHYNSWHLLSSRSCGPERGTCLLDKGYRGSGTYARITNYGLDAK